MSLRKKRRSAASALVLLTLAVFVSWIAVGGCALTTDVSGLTGGADGGADATAAATGYAIGGTVRGLEGAEVTLVLNATESVVVKTEDPFVFPRRLASGADYLVTVLGTSDKRTCKVTHEQGRVALADVTDIAVVCPSPNAQLSKLTLSTGALSPVFSPLTVGYTAATIIPDVFDLDVPNSVTATTESPAATLTINGAVAKSGVAIPVAGLHAGANTISVKVTAANGVAQATYTIAATEDAQEAYIKASNTHSGNQLGASLAVSDDGSTLAVGAPHEANGGVGVDGPQTGTVSLSAGAVYVFRRSGTTWAQEAYVKASNTGEKHSFGASVALSGDGSTLVVGAPGETSNSTVIDGNQGDVSAPNSGAAYVFRRTGTTWKQEAYVKASNTRAGANFGWALGLSGSGNTLAVTAVYESSAATGINGDPSNSTSAASSGAVYVFTRAGATWTQETYVKASNARLGSTFGSSLALSSDGSTLAVGSTDETSAAKGIGGNQNDTSAKTAGAAYVFVRAGATWEQEAYVKASNTRADARFGYSVALSGDGNKLAVGSPYESSNALGVGGNQLDISAEDSGAAYVFARSGTTWSQEAYVKASNTRAFIQALFGCSVALSGDGKRLAVGAKYERSAGFGINGVEDSMTMDYRGAVYAFGATGETWKQTAYVKAAMPHGDPAFGTKVALSLDGFTLAVGAAAEGSGATGVNGNQLDSSASASGAVYVFR